MTFSAFDPTALAPPLESLDGHVRGFCTARETKAALLKYGLSEQQVFQRGIGAEDMDPCIATFRGRPGWLVLAQDLRAFGGTKRLVAKRADELELAKIRILDISHPEDRTYSALCQRAQVAISGARFGHDRRRARRMGRDGGLGRGRRAIEARDAIAHRSIIDRIVDHPRIPWEVKVQILAPHFTESTLRRHYGSNPTAQKA